MKPVVPDAVETAAEDFFAKPEEPVQTVAPEAPAPVVTPGIPVQPEAAEQPEAEGPDSIFRTPTLPTTDEPSVPVRVMADNVMAMRSAPDEDGWISITSEPVEEKDLNTLVAAAMEKPAVGEQAAATAPPRSRKRRRPTSTNTPASTCLKSPRRRATPTRRTS